MSIRAYDGLHHHASGDHETSPSDEKSHVGPLLRTGPGAGLGT
ncbi:MAG TPA: hypothetical protein VES20_20735 [Bryobacteraceae bacterium]|nr:hypothetical protein [Bryobacteraceae bacterium]